MPPIGWPTSYTIGETIKNVKADTTRYIGLSKIAPFQTSVAHKIKYKVYTGGGGMTQAHMLDGNVKLKNKGKVEEKEFNPLYWKEKAIFTERDMLGLETMQPGHQTMQIDEMIGIELKEQKDRVVKRIEWMIWQAILNGKILVEQDDIKITADYEVPDANITKTPAVKWNVPATAKPLTDITNTQINDFPGTGFSLGTVQMNSKTLQYLCDANDTYTKYKGSTVKETFSVGTAPLLLKILFPNVDFLIYDEFYDDESGITHRFIPDGYVVFWPQCQPGDIIDFVSVPSLSNKVYSPGIFATSKDKTDESSPTYEVTTGVYGAPRLYRPKAYFVMYVL